VTNLVKIVISLAVITVWVLFGAFVEIFDRWGVIWQYLFVGSLVGVLGYIWKRGTSKEKPNQE